MRASAKPGNRNRFGHALTKTRSLLAEGLGGLFTTKGKLGPEILERIETALLLGDVGTEATSDIIAGVERKTHRRSLADSNVVLQALRSELIAIASPLAKPLKITTQRPFVILIVGVNGCGKTTTIGKLSARLQSEGHSVLLAAGDTFRAAAIEQLQAWGDRTGAPVIAQRQGADSGSVIYDSIDSARARGIDVVLADTAGRLQANAGLMQELAKVRRVMAKLDPDAPHECLLVLDGGVGQNALSQVEVFSRDVGLTGLVVTKLDGTAKAGVLFAIARRFALPIRFVGLGESLDDLQPFDAESLVDALLSP